MATINFYVTGNARPTSSNFKVRDNDVERMVNSRMNLSATSMLPRVDYAVVELDNGHRGMYIRDDVKGIRFVDYREY